jgi:hypothetical protein
MGLVLWESVPIPRYEGNKTNWHVYCIEWSEATRPYIARIKGGITMSTTTLIIVIIVLVLVFGGGGGYYWRRRR